MPINPDRIRILDKADRRPMVDVFDKDTDGPIVDLGIDLTRYFGHIHIKVKHFRFIAQNFLGMVSKEDQAVLAAERDEYKDRYLKAQSKLELLQEERQEIFDAKLTEFLANYSHRDPTITRLGNDLKDVIANVATGGLTEVKSETEDSKSKTEIDLDD